MLMVYVIYGWIGSVRAKSLFKPAITCPELNPYPINWTLNQNTIKLILKFHLLQVTMFDQAMDTIELCNR